MAHNADLGGLANHAALGVRQRAQHRLERIAVTALGQIAFHFTARTTMNQPGASAADAFDLAARCPRFVGGIEERVLE